MLLLGFMLYASIRQNDAFLQDDFMWLTFALVVSEGGVFVYECISLHVFEC